MSQTDGIIGTLPQGNSRGAIGVDADELPVLFPTWQVLAASTFALSHTGDTVDPALATISIPADLLGANGILHHAPLVRDEQRQYKNAKGVAEWSERHCVPLHWSGLSCYVAGPDDHQQPDSNTRLFTLRCEEKRHASHLGYRVASRRLLGLRNRAWLAIGLVAFRLAASFGCDL
jgi:hypothetical protein